MAKRAVRNPLLEIGSDSTVGGIFKKTQDASGQDDAGGLEDMYSDIAKAQQKKKDEEAQKKAIEQNKKDEEERKSGGRTRRDLIKRKYWDA